MWSSYFEFRYMMMSGAPGVRGPVSGLGFARVVGARWCACVMGAHVLPTNHVRSGRRPRRIPRNRYDIRRLFPIRRYLYLASRAAGYAGVCGVLRRWEQFANFLFNV